MRSIQAVFTHKGKKRRTDNIMPYPYRKEFSLENTHDLASRQIKLLHRANAVMETFDEGSNSKRNLNLVFCTEYPSDAGRVQSDFKIKLTDGPVIQFDKAELLGCCYIKDWAFIANDYEYQAYSLQGSASKPAFRLILIFATAV